MINIDTSIKIKASKLFLETWNNDEVAESLVQKSNTINFSCSASRALLKNSSLIFTHKRSSIKYLDILLHHLQQMKIVKTHLIHANFLVTIKIL